MNAPQRRKMDLLLARFVDAMTAWGWSKRTIPAYEQHVRVFLDWLERETDIESLAEVTGETLTSYQAWLFTAEKLRSPAPKLRRRGEPTGERISTATQGARLIALKSFFHFLAHEGKLLVDPAASLTLPKRRKLLPQPLLTPKEAIKLCESIDTKTPIGLRNRAIVEVFYACGIRNAELRVLVLSDFDANAATLTIRGGKGNKDRVVPLGPLASAVVSDYIAQARPKLVRRIWRRDTAPHLFLSKNGRRLHASAVILIVQKAAVRAGITKPIRPHRLRHACATHMLKGGADIRHIQKLLGHSSLATTQIYTQVEISDLKTVHRRFHPRERGRG